MPERYFKCPELWWHTAQSQGLGAFLIITDFGITGTSLGFAYFPILLICLGLSTFCPFDCETPRQGLVQGHTGLSSVL